MQTNEIAELLATTVAKQEEYWEALAALESALGCELDDVSDTLNTHDAASLMAKVAEASNGE